MKQLFVTQLFALETNYSNIIILVVPKYFDSKINCYNITIMQVSASYLSLNTAYILAGTFARVCTSCFEK